MSRIVVKDVHKGFDREGGRVEVLAGTSFELTAPLISAVIGCNGCGKSTLLNVIAGLLPPDSGSVRLEVESQRKPRIGYFWQDYRASLLPWLDVADNIAFPQRLQRVPRDRRRQAAESLLFQFTHQIFPNQRIYELSGGQQQLVCVLRTLMAQPDILLLDEPASALDQQTRWSMVFALEAIWMRRPVPMVVVTHDVDEAILVADEINLMTRSGGTTFQHSGIRSLEFT